MSAPAIFISLVFAARATRGCPAGRCSQNRGNAAREDARPTKFGAVVVKTGATAGKSGAIVADCPAATEGS